MSSNDAPNAVLERLLSSWRDHRAPELADAIDRAAERVIPSRTDLATLPKKSVHAAWMTLASKRAASDLGALLDALTVGTLDEIGARLAELSQWPDDPRLAMAAAKLIEAVPFQSTSSQKHWTRIFALVNASGDFRTLAVLQRVEKNPVAISGSSMNAWMTNAVRKATRALEAQFVDGPLALTEAQRAMVGTTEKPAPVADEVRSLASLLPPPVEASGAVSAPVRDLALAAGRAPIVGVMASPDVAQVVVVVSGGAYFRERFACVVRVADRSTRWVWKTGEGASAVSPDGRVVMFHDGDGRLELRSLESGDSLGKFEADPERAGDQFQLVKNCAWSPSGETVAVTYQWSYRTQRSISVLQLSDGVVRPLVVNDAMSQTAQTTAERAAFSADGQWLWTQSPRRVTKVRVATGEAAVRFEPRTPDGRFTSIAVDPTGARVATSRSDGGIDLWRADDGAHEASLDGHTGYALSMRFTPDGRGLLSAATYNDARGAYDPRVKVKDPVARFWDAHARTLAREWTLEAMPVEVALSDDGRRAVVASEGEVRVFALPAHVADGPTPELTESLAQGGFEVSALAFARDADVMVSVAHGGATTVWSVASGQPLATWEVGMIHALAVAPDGMRYATTGGKSVTLRATRDKRPLGELKGHAKNIHAIAFAPDGATVATGSDDRAVILWDASKCSEIRALKGHRGRVGALAFTSDGRVLVSAADDGRVCLWEVSSGALVAECQCAAGVIRAMGVSDDGRVAVVATTEGASLWELSTGTKRADLAGHAGAVVGAAMRPDGAMAATFGEDRTVRLWRVSDGAEVARLDGWLYTPGVNANTSERWTMVSGALAFSGDGRSLAAGSGREEGGGALRLLGW